MAGVEIAGLTKRFGETIALHPTDLTVEDGEFLVLIGPSGCGKSTLLRMIAGLEAPGTGRIAIGGRDVTDAAPSERGVAMVFQSYALYPQMTVAQNIAFPLKVAGVPKREIAERVGAVAAMLDLGDLLERRPRALSGGQRQRVSIARAVVRNPRVLLLDEPLSNLDTGLRARMRHEFARLHQRLGATMIYVTHDQLEAMTLANRIVVMSAGRIDIRLRGAINNPNGDAANSIAALCVDQPTLDNPFCGQISRAQGTGFINGYTVQPANVAAFRTAGAELNIAYRVRTTRIGAFDVRLVGGYLDKLEQIATPGAEAQDNVDQIFRPRWNAVFSPTWINGPLTLAYNLRWQNGVRRFSRAESDGNPNLVEPRYFRYKELWQRDVQAQIAVARDFAFYGGVNNLSDQKPDIGFQTNVPISPAGRYFYAGAKVMFGGR